MDNATRIRAWEHWDGISERARGFSLLLKFHTGSGTYPASFPGLKRPGREVNPSPPSFAEVKNEWVYNSSPPTYLHRVDKEIFIIIIIIINYWYYTHYPRTLWWCVTPYVNINVLEESLVFTVYFWTRRLQVSCRHPPLFSRPQSVTYQETAILTSGIRTVPLVCWQQLTVSDAPRTAAASLTDQHPQHFFSTGTLPLSRRKCRHKIPAKL